MNLKSHFVLLLGVIIGVSLCQLFKSCGETDEPMVHYPGEKNTETKKEFEKKEQKFLAKEDSLTKHDAGLKKELFKTKHSLQQLKETNTLLKTQLLNLLDKKVEPDSAAVKEYSNTLINKANEFIENNNQKDSCYEAVNDNLEQQVSNKDSLIIVQKEKYTELKLALEKSSTANSFLTEENNQLRKQFKRQKIKRRFLSALVLAASGVAAGILLHR